MTVVLTIASLLVSTLMMLGAVASAGQRAWRLHLLMRNSSLLEVQDEDHFIQIDLDHIEKVPAATLRRALQALQAVETRPIG